MAKDYDEAIKEIVKKMKEKNTYSDSYMDTIEVLARTKHDYNKAIEVFEKTGGNIVIEHTNKAGATNVIKNPIYLSIEKLRSDIVSFSKELGLTPTSKVQDGKTKDASDELMRFLNE